MSPQSVVVTGASGTTGQAITLELAHAGFDVIATTRTEEKAAALRQRVADTGASVRTVLLDVADPVSAVRAFTEIATWTDGGPWAVVNNAGFPQPGAVEDVDDEQVRRQLETNLVAPARIARLVLPAMRERRDGRIVNVSSVAGRVSMPMLGWYCASERALETVTDALRMESAPFGVKVSLVEPGSYGSLLRRGCARLLPELRGSAYRAQYSAVGEAARRCSRQAGPRPVARAVLRALSAARPMPRYLVGGGARSTAALDAVAPTVASDWAKQLLTGLREAPPRVARAMRLPTP
ncbi:SDR family NAD(P)-dependent oxidoreductase [Streptomyces sp. PTM05]|uniref:SDR family NAD(P)-dependent oxidoreductase n=1 Tax=Streptantibioticus parmotrematis TaxID=2873249 RepID=A0ABS7QV87_9ACTN|nr:SDR family NAD(P)-dependent oxidoreductase [Streptantibioticus parmotrematis]MBY8887122.1 SDR family NAD(P)-dependent oxidoreductase [Streptantibioticus parmotrematis]